MKHQKDYRNRIERNIVIKRLFANFQNHEMVDHPELHFIRFTKTDSGKIIISDKSCILAYKHDGSIVKGSAPASYEINKDNGLIKCTRQKITFMLNGLNYKKSSIDISIRNDLIKHISLDSEIIKSHSSQKAEKMIISTVPDDIVDDLNIFDAGLIIINGTDYSIPYTYLFDAKVNNDINFEWLLKNVQFMLCTKCYFFAYDSRFSTFNTKNVSESLLTGLHQELIADVIDNHMKVYAKESIEYDDAGDVIKYSCNKAGLVMERVNRELQDDQTYNYEETLWFAGFQVYKINRYGNDFVDVIDSECNSIEAFESADGLPLSKSKDVKSYKYSFIGEFCTTIFPQKYKDNSIYKEKNDSIVCEKEKTKRKYITPINTVTVDISETDVITKYYSPHGFNYATYITSSNESILRFINKDTAKFLYLNTKFAAGNITTSYVNSANITYSEQRNQSMYNYNDDTVDVVTMHNDQSTSISSKILSDKDPVYIRDSYGIPRLYCTR